MKQQYLYCPLGPIPIGFSFDSRLNDKTTTEPIVFDNLWRNGFTFTVRKAGSEELVVVTVDPNNLNAVINVKPTVPTADQQNTMTNVDSGRYCGKIINGTFHSFE